MIVASVALTIAEAGVPLGAVIAVGVHRLTTRRRRRYQRTLRRIAELEGELGIDPSVIENATTTAVYVVDYPAASLGYVEKFISRRMREE